MHQQIAQHTAISLQSISPPATRNKLIAGNFRALFSKPRDEQQTASFLADMENTIAYMRAHREHKVRAVI